MSRVHLSEVEFTIVNGVTYMTITWGVNTTPFFMVIKENDHCDDEVIARGIGRADLNEILTRKY
jgi:hypothetical protein